jgi:hypothetical protein
MQAEISGKGNKPFSLIFSSKESEPPNPETESPVKLVKLPEKNPSCSPPSKKDPKPALLEILKTTGGKLEKEEFRQKALEKGIAQEKFETILKNLLETGELYSPQPGIIKIV